MGDRGGKEASAEIREVSGPFPEEPVHEPTDLFEEDIGDRPVVQWLQELPKEDWQDHYATRLANFTELSMAHVSVKVGEHHPAHFHAEGPHILFVLDGMGSMRVGDVEFAVGPGALVIVPPGTPHFAENTGDTPLNYINLTTPSRP